MIKFLAITLIALFLSACALLPTSKEEFGCRWAARTVIAKAEEKANWYTYIYAASDMSAPIVKYGRWTGWYYGPNGTAAHGPAIDGQPVVTKDGRPWTMERLAKLRANIAPLPKDICDWYLTDKPVPNTKLLGE